MSEASPRLLRAWRDASYEAGGLVVRIGQRSVALDAMLRSLGSANGAFVAAGNPGGRRWPAGRNARLLAALLERARGLPYRSGQGSGRRWQERHVLLACDSRRAMVLARRFRQGGLVLVGRGKRARLALLSRG